MLFFLFKALIISRVVVNLIFLGKDLFYCMRAQHVLSYHLILVPWTTGLHCEEDAGLKVEDLIFSFCSSSRLPFFIPPPPQPHC